VQELLPQSLDKRIQEGEEFIVHSGAPPAAVTRRAEEVQVASRVVNAGVASYDVGDWIIWEYVLEYIKDKKYVSLGIITAVEDDGTLLVKWYRTQKNEFNLNGRYRCYNHRHREHVPASSVIYVFSDEFRLKKDGSIPCRDRRKLENLKLGDIYDLTDPPQPP
jgi:hypothetical protein